MIYIWIRRTLDWSDEEAFWAQIDDRIRPGVELWNATLNMPFHRFRDRVRAIAALNHSEVGDATVADWDEIPDGSLVLPVDDDDWFAPDIVSVLSPRLDGAIGFRWPSSWVEVPLNFGHRLSLFAEEHLGKPRTFYCTTNNYALVRRREYRELLRFHTVADPWFMAVRHQPEGPRLRLLERHLSLANRNLGSSTVMRRIHRRSHLLSRLRRYKRLYRRKLRSDLRWAQPYVSRMAELMDELEPART
jgi:hypothetical protein